MKARLHSMNLIAGLMGLAMFLAACGGSFTKSTGTGSTPTAPGPLSFLSSSSPFPGFHGGISKTTALSAGFAGFEASQTVSVNGSLSGFCASVPESATFVVYGFGRWDDSNCKGHWDMQTNSGTLLIGDGTLGPLVVTAHGTGAGDASGTVHIYVQAAGTTTQTDTGITCAIGTSQDAVCEDTTHSYAVHDHDRIVAKAITLAGDQFEALQVVIGKQ